MLETPQELWDWFYNPGEVVRSIGFYKNPFGQWQFTKFSHVFATDDLCNLFVGQFSVYKQHLIEFFGNSVKFTEHGKIIFRPIPLVVLDRIDKSNISVLNQRLKKLAQRLYDYGLPLKTVILLDELDNPTLDNILKQKPAIRPDKVALHKQLGLL